MFPTSAICRSDETATADDCSQLSASAQVISISRKTRQMQLWPLRGLGGGISGSELGSIS